MLKLHADFHGRGAKSRR